MKPSEETRIVALLARKQATEKDEMELDQGIQKAAAAGEMMYNYIENSNGKYPTISNEYIQELKDNGYKVDIWDKNGWDDLRRYYKGILTISWFK